jgi:DNA-binding NarL/FixJ family response regulator
MINVLVVDDQKTSQQYLKTVLEVEPDLKIVGLANNGKEAIEQVAKLQPNIVIMDIDMPVLDGLTATKVITERYPLTKVLIFSLNDDDKSLSHAIEVGSKGYLYKSTPSEDIALAIRSAHQGYFQLGPGLLEKYLYRFTTNSSLYSEINQKLTQSPASTFSDKNPNLNFVLDRTIRNVYRLEKISLLNRSLIYLLFLVNSFLLFLLFLDKS